MTGEEMAACDIPDKLSMFSYLTHLYEAFRGEIPHIKHLKLVNLISISVLFFFFFLTRLKFFFQLL